MQGFAHLASRLPVLMAPGRHGIDLCRRNITPELQPIGPRNVRSTHKPRYLLAVLFVKSESMI
jgi:hypothetical protein